MKQPCARTAVLSLAASLFGLAAPLLAAHPAYAQKISDLPSLSPIRMASDAEVRSFGIVQGDIVIPYSNLEEPGDAGVKMHTNFLISRRPAIAAEGLPSKPMMTLMGLALASPVSLPIVLPVMDDLQPAATGSGPSGLFLPPDLKKAYGLPSTGGAGTIVLIGGYHYATALSDFNAFASATGLPTEPSTNATLNSNKVFQVVYANGRPPIVDSRGANGFAFEAALDIEWAHAMAPNAKIVLVEGNSASTYDLLLGAVGKANGLPGVREVSMSFGSGEFSSEIYYDGLFTKSGIVYFASTGDTGGVISYPSCSPNVVGVGGTSLTTTGGTAQAYSSEAGWSGSGGGVSTIETKPSYQNGVTYNGTTPARRAVPDVSLVADPNTGVYIIYNGGGYGVGGTSLSCPALAGIVNLSGSNRASTSAELSNLYSIYSSGTYSTNFHDIISGTAGSYSTYTGYDLVTGIGTPKGLGGL